MTLFTMGKSRLLVFLAIGQVLNILWHFESWHRSQWKILKCKRSLTRLIEERNGWKSGICSVQKCKCKVLFIVWFFEFSLGSFRALSKFPMAKFLKGYSQSFHPISTKFYGKYGNQRGIQAITLIFGDMPNCTLTISQTVPWTTLPLSIKLCWFHLAKRSSRVTRPLGLLF